MSLKKTTVLLSVTFLTGMGLPISPAGNNAAGPSVAWAAPQQPAAQQPAAGQRPTTWSGREEYDAYTAMANEKDPTKKLSLAEAFLQKYPSSFVADLVYVTMMQACQQLGDGNKALEIGRRALTANPDNIDALTLSAYIFPFVFKGNDPDAASKLSAVENDSKHALELVQKMQKPANVTDEQFNQGIKARRALFNGMLGFVALQRKDYAAAIASFKTSAEDNPSDVYTFYRLGIAYISTDPRDYNNAIWSLARSASLAKAGKNPAADEIERYLKQVYINYHGNDQGLADIMSQAAASPNPPEGFKVAQMEVPTDTGNASVDAFNKTFFQLKYGGERAQKLWDALKGQPFGVGGFVESVEKAPDNGAYLVRIDILDQSKSADGVYDIELKDSTQPNVKNLSKGDAVHFQGTIASYAAEPGLVITLDNGTINEDELPDQPKVAPKSKTAPKPKAPARKAAPKRRAG
ncbi:MAG: tetratricopeptide repeat protein [Terriglobia bacterium]